MFRTHQTLQQLTIFTTKYRKQFIITVEVNKIVFTTLSCLVIRINGKKCYFLLLHWNIWIRRKTYKIEWESTWVIYRPPAILLFFSVSCINCCCMISLFFLTSWTLNSAMALFDVFTNIEKLCNGSEASYKIKVFSTWQRVKYLTKYHACDKILSKKISKIICLS